MSARLNQLKDNFMSGKPASSGSGSQPWNPDSDTFPLRSSLPSIPNAPPEAAWFWGKDDELGRLNLLTPKRVKAAASSSIQTGEVVPLNLPLNVPLVPGFGREPFVHSFKTLLDDVAYDDKYECNTQSGSQWDGFRHFAHIPSKTFYNGVTGRDIVGPEANNRCGIHVWAEHGFAGRGVLIDYWSFANTHPEKTYDPFEGHAISLDELTACAKAQGVDIRPASQGGDIQIGDIVLIRTGFVSAYHHATEARRKEVALRGHGPNKDGDTDLDSQLYAGLQQSEEMLTWFHDSYFAAVAGDAPAFERWPTAEKYHLHEYILALWGMPLGEMLDLERLSETCKKENRWTFFFQAIPQRCVGGVASWANATAIF